MRCIVEGKYLGTEIVEYTDKEGKKQSMTIIHIYNYTSELITAPVNGNIDYQGLNFGDDVKADVDLFVKNDRQKVRINDITSL